MSTAALLDQDVGSESEDDVNFHPAPADDSEGEQDGRSDDDEVVAPRSRERASNGKANDGEVEGDHVEEDEIDDSERLREGAVRRERSRSRTRSRTRSDDGEQNKETEPRRADRDDQQQALAGGENPDDEGEEDDDDEEDEDEDDDEEISGHRRKRTKKRQAHSGFFDLEADVSDAEEDPEEEEDELREAEGFIDNTHPDDEARLPLAGDIIDDRQHRELDRRRELEAGLDAEKQAEEYRKRYGRNRQAATDVAVIPKRMLLPSVEDPNIWGVKCKPGKEREILFGLIKRVEERATTRDPLAITSAFERGGTMAGYIYVEARRKEDVLTALDGLSNVYPRSQQILVPIKEMPDLLRTRKSKPIEPGSYVRIKRGKYAGDLAQVESLTSNGLEIELRVVPRLDYGLMEDVNAPMPANVDGKRKRLGGVNSFTNRPPPRLFSETEAKKKHLKYLQANGNRGWQYLSDQYVGGFLIKDFKLQYLLTEGVNPTLEEVTRFASGAEDGTESLDLGALAATLKASSEAGAYLPGDAVEVYDGEQKGLCGKVIRLLNGIVTIRVSEGIIAGQTVEVPVKSLRKRFREGDHVKVIGGSKYRDDVGMVVRIAGDKVTLVSDQSMNEITVFSKDLREASDGGRAGGYGNFDLHDLVQLDPATVGIVVKVDRESLRVLDQDGSVRTMIPSQVSNKLEKRRHAVATDRNGSEIRNDDTVREIGGEGKQGTIICIYRSFLFLHSREVSENGGNFVVRANNVATIAAKGGRIIGNGTSGPDLTKMNPQRNGTNGKAGVMSAPPPPKSFGRDRTIGKTVIVRKGPLKGLLGIVKDTTDKDARVELHARGKILTIAKNILGVKDPLTGQTIDMQSFGGAGAGRGHGEGGRVSYGGATPQQHTDWAGSRTPMAAAQGGRTPAWGPSARTPAWAGASASSGGGGGVGGRTPAWKQDANIGGRTPAYAPDGARTVNPYASNAGNRTSYGSGNKTPAWSPGAGTPFGGHHGSSNDHDDGFNPGSRTPAYGTGATDNYATGGRTPAYDSITNDTWGSSTTGAAATAAAVGTPGIISSSTVSTSHAYGSRPYDAPTPGVALNAPTPGATFNAPTPGPYSAPTPAPFSAPTPKPSWSSHGPDTAPTPAASGMPMSAPTPAASGNYGNLSRGAPTPGAGYGAPDTPGVWASADADGEDDDEPRYVD